MKKLFLILLSLAMTVTVVACGSSEPVETEEPEAEVELDVLAGTTYEMTSYEYDEGNGWEKGEVSKDQIPKIHFNEDGTYEETVYEPDYESEDFETLYEKKYTGTYTVDGDSVTLKSDLEATEEPEMTTEDGEVVPLTDEEKEALKYDIKIVDNTIVMQMDYAKITKDNGDISEYPGSRSTYTKVE